MSLEGVIFIHKKGLLHKNLKSNNILLRSDGFVFTPVIVDMGKATLRRSPEVYKLNEKQKESYNKKYPHLAFELRNIVIEEVKH